MAEFVQKHVERIIPELEQMERIGLFTRGEIKKVIRKRRAMEYRLQSRVKTKENYLKYIQYEIKLLSLIRKRREKMNCFYKKKEIDQAIAVRITKLFKAAIYRFQGDVRLWLSHIEFCKRMKWSFSISGMFSRMLQVHNKNPAVWLCAAKWEFEENNAPENARSLLQRAIRFHTDVQLLWQEYYRMELIYTDQIRKRREILGVKDTTDVKDAVFQGKIAMVVFNQAVNTIHDVEFALSFLPICCEFDFTEEHANQIINHVQSRHGDKEIVWHVMAKRILEKKNVSSHVGEGLPRHKAAKQLETEAFSVYEKGLQSVHTRKMWSLYLQTALERLQKSKSDKSLKKKIGKIFELMQRASEEDLLAQDLYLEWARLLNTFDKVEEAKELSIRVAQKWSTNTDVWLFCLHLHVQSKTDKETVSTLLNDAIKKVSDKDALPIWKFGVEWTTIACPEKLKDLLENAISVNCPVVSLPMKELYLEIVSLKDGVSAARTLYIRLKNIRPLSLGFFKKMISIENAQLTPSVKHLRTYFEDAILDFGQIDVDLWIDYIRLELSHLKGKPENCGKVYWRAVKKLTPAKADDFVNQFTMLQTGHDISQPEYED
ncbi:LOW QUALITY PROTEIN: U3 small nucleolar RNA-associated protein 6 homolog [Tachypleus tridentatus]|uniref:LOW QUALITY PROTEIN: U3 small nucleolar RNA-associated protein 6 homolog n=1 Tax=Tachypleus tridentatus TaxID=6853 RepID=UPI003FD0A98B